MLGRGGAKLVADDDSPLKILAIPQLMAMFSMIDIATISADQTVVVTYTIDVPGGENPAEPPTFGCFYGRR